MTRTEKTTLLEQLHELGVRRLDPRWLPAAGGYSALAQALALKAFHERWPEGLDTAIVRRALDCFSRPGAPWILPEEPGV